MGQKTPDLTRYVFLLETWPSAKPSDVILWLRADPFQLEADRAGEYLTALQFKYDLGVIECFLIGREMLMAFIKVIKCAERLVSDASTTARHRYAKTTKRTLRLKSAQRHHARCKVDSTMLEIVMIFLP